LKGYNVYRLEKKWAKKITPKLSSPDRNEEDIFGHVELW
jgi:hypothetical protein